MGCLVIVPAEANKALSIVQKRLAKSLVAVYLHGSAVAGELRPRSDVDLLVVIDQPMTSEVRRCLTSELMEISGRYPFDPDGRHPLEVIIFLRSDLAVKEEFCDYRKFSSPVKVQLEAGRSVTGVNYLDAQRFRGFFQNYFGALFDDFDVICLPTLPVVAPQINQEEVQIGDRTVSTQDAMTFTNQLANMLGCPAISIPAGNDAQGLPVGVTFLMPHGRDLELLQFAARVEGLLRGAGITP